MSNIKPNPSFTPTPGTPTAAPRGFPYAHDNLAEVDRKAAEAMRDAVERRP